MVLKARRSPVARTAFHSLQQTPRQVRRDRRAAVDHLQHRLPEAAKPGIFDQLARGADLKRVHGVLFILHG